MRIHAIMPASRANGPGLRAVIWVQGCSLNCPGCWNPATHARATGIEHNPEDLAAQLAADAPEGVIGVTISGGEPMQQAEHLYRFLCYLRAIRPQWTRGLFSGYTKAELWVGEYDYCSPLRPQVRANLWNHQIMPALDWAILGRYDASRATGDALVSSSNQALYLYSTRHSRADFDSAPQYEATINPSGLVTVTGFPTSNRRTTT